MIPVATVSAVHEQVQKRAGGHQEPGQHPEHVSPMLGPEEEGGNRQEHAQRDAARCSKEAPASRPISSAHESSPRLTSARARSSSLALMATMTVLSDMKAAPSAGVSTSPQA
jgi:hypothetical protein